MNANIISNFLAEKIYDKIPIIKKKDKVIPKVFTIPNCNEYNDILYNWYKIDQLKSICKYYKLKKTGNKEEISNRIYNFLKYSNYALVIQKNIRRRLCVMYIKSGGPAFFKRNLCINESDFLTMEPFDDIPYNQFFSFKDCENMIYGFDIISLHNLIKKAKSSNDELQNPYNRMVISDNHVENMYKHIKLGKALGLVTEISIEEDIVDSKKRIELRIIGLFQEINALGNYADSKWFTNLHLRQMLLFIRELYDIWYYRAQLTPTVMRDICPPNGNPFYNLQQYNTIGDNNHMETIKNNALTIIENMVSRGITDDSKALGAYYILASLTLVSDDARNALPWLYESVAPNIG